MINRRGINREGKSGDGVIAAVLNFAGLICDYRWVVSDGDALIVKDLRGESYFELRAIS